MFYSIQYIVVCVANLFQRQVYKMIIFSEFFFKEQKIHFKSVSSFIKSIDIFGAVL